MHTPPPENRTTAVLTPFPGIPTSAENPDFRSAVEIPRMKPYPGCPRVIPVQTAGAIGRLVADGGAQKPRTRRGFG